MHMHRDRHTCTHVNIYIHACAGVGMHTQNVRKGSQCSWAHSLRLQEVK